ncbi:MAG: inositol monophosphatase family protein [Elusimicrobiota bacterium]|nr:inositol monophosphatase family protein [Elusimicrobiota bacterium]
MASKNVMSDDIVSRIVAVIVLVIRTIKNDVKLNPASSLRTFASQKKSALEIDLFAQGLLRMHFQKIFKQAKLVVYIGSEECHELPKGWETHDALILTDPIDGTDLFAKDLSNWCCAVVVYKKKRILGAFIGMPNETVYFSTYRINGVRKRVPGIPEPVKVVCPRHDDVKLSETTIAWYGQKIKNLFALVRNKKLLAKLEEIEKAEAANKKNKNEDGKFRILNIAGNPMFMKIIDNHCSVGAVIELLGQKPHDVVPGAYLAQQAGAIFTDLNGKEINLSSCLKDPENNRVSYILSNSNNTWKELVEILKADPDIQPAHPANPTPG